MKFEYLKKFAHNGILEISQQEMWVRPGPDHSQQSSIVITKSTSQEPLTLTLSRKVNGGGMWVPYVTQKNVYGLMEAGHIWAASGPFSGCVFEIGELNGRIYVAHLSREAANDPNIDAWNNLAGRRVLFTKSIDCQYMPQMNTAGLATIAFAYVEGTNVSVTQMDVRTENAGGMTGRIMAVTKLTTD